MRTFVDHNGAEWKVYAVGTNAGTHRWTYLPEEYVNGWLCFDSTVGKRRLTPIPPRWRDMSDTELENLKATAQPVNRNRPLEFDGETDVDGTTAR
jgi:hypothetical protein